MYCWDSLRHPNLRTVIHFKTLAVYIYAELIYKILIEIHVGVLTHLNLQKLYFTMRYRRANLPGASYFFTVNLAERKSRLLVKHVDVLRESVRRVKTAHPFVIDAMVIMPDHLHALWTLPEGDSDFSTRWGLIKSGFSRHIEATERISPSRQTKGERGIWQRRFWETSYPG